MAKRKEKEEETEKVEKKVVKKQKDIQPQLFSQKELANMLGISVYQLDSMYSIRGLNRKTKLSLEDAHKLFTNVV